DLRKPAAKSARAAPHQSLPAPSGSKIDPGDISRRFALATGVTLRPPNGGCAFCNAAKSALRRTGSLAKAARELTAFAAVPARCLAHPGAVIACAIASGIC